jgi:hypothetical protein
MYVYVDLRHGTGIVSALLGYIVLRHFPHFLLHTPRKKSTVHVLFVCVIMHVPISAVA